ncbi:MAG: hypothetical protein C0625_02090 [Arcobacter sp.]|nr:MAG: hypothetical protein C0625_02090 [Arcobacter sp.]
MQEYEIELKKDLSQIASCEKYFGEFSSVKAIQIDTSKLPIIYVDFIEEDPISSFELNLKFSLYIAQASFSNNKKTRQKQHNEIEELLLKINEKLYSKTILDSQPIKIGASKKILDAKNESAYITIFQKNLEFTIPKIHIQGEYIE